MVGQSLVGMDGTQNFVHSIYREKIPRYRVYRGTCFVIVVTKVKHSAHSTIKLRRKFVYLSVILSSLVATSNELIH